MKIKSLIIALLVALAGCSASVKGDVQGVNTPENANGSRYVVSHTAAGHSGTAINR